MEILNKCSFACCDYSNWHDVCFVFIQLMSKSEGLHSKMQDFLYGWHKNFD